MPNPIFGALGGGAKNMPAPMQFIQFMNQHKGKDPNQILNQLMSSGRVNQQMLDQAQQTAKQMQGQFDALKSMFGF